VLRHRRRRRRRRARRRRRPNSIEVTLTEFAIEPATLEAAAGSPLTFSISNDGAAPHTFAVTAGDETYETPSIAGALR